MPCVIPVILCGGAGTRLWPSSRESCPKQFLPLLGERSTFEDALGRVSDPALFAEPLVVTAEDFRFLAVDQLVRAGLKAKLVLEPMRRDSAPAVALAAEIASAADPGALLLVLAADHVIQEHELFRDVARAALPAAAAGAIVTFGVRPTAPATAYGYIQPGATFSGAVRHVAAFTEKPDAERAARFITDGCLWNSGNFMFQAGVFLQELARFEPEIADAARRAVAGATTETIGGVTFVRADTEAFAASPAKSVDYAVMERTDLAVVIEASYSWSDLGSWNALWEISEKDAAGNATRGRVTLLDAKNCLVDGEAIATAVVGLEDVAVITSDDAVLVARRDVAGEMKTLHATIARSDRKLVDEHVRMYRPWGWYRRVDLGERFQVKRLHVAPGKRLSLQKHFHRAEHWVVVKGTATVTIDGDTRLVRENESVYLPLGCWHRLANENTTPLEIVEVQSGGYLGEDDIVRSEDDFKRV